jgi:hypothetical protein
VVDRVVEQGLHEALEHGRPAPRPTVGLDEDRHEGEAVAKLAVVFNKRVHDGNGIVEGMLPLTLQRAGYIEDAFGNAEQAKHGAFNDLAPCREVGRWGFLGKQTGGRGQESQRAAQLVYNKGHGVRGFGVHAISTFQT